MTTAVTYVSHVDRWEARATSCTQRCAVQRRRKYSLGATPSALRNIAANALGLS